MKEVERDQHFPNELNADKLVTNELPDETEDAQDDGSADPWAPENIQIVQTIILMRIYDALMALLNDNNPSEADRLDDLHSAGKIYGPFPSYKGE